MVREQQRAVGARECPGEVHDADALERSRRAAADRGKELQRVAVAKDRVAIDLLAVDDERGRLRGGDPEIGDDLARGAARGFDAAAAVAVLTKLAVEDDVHHASARVPLSG